MIMDNPTSTTSMKSCFVWNAPIHFVLSGRLHLHTIQFQPAIDFYMCGGVEEYSSRNKRNVKELGIDGNLHCTLQLKLLHPHQRHRYQPSLIPESRICRATPQHTNSAIYNIILLHTHDIIGFPKTKNNHLCWIPRGRLPCLRCFEWHHLSHSLSTNAWEEHPSPITICFSQTPHNDKRH